jgi:class 3 adenylate cyclase
MMVPENETARVAALGSYDILDTRPEVSYDELTELAARICQCPVAYVKFIDATRAWFKSKVGFPPDLIQVPREITICATTICQSDLMVIPDTILDDRFRDNPTVCGWPHIRFYCGMPLIDREGYALGTMCVLDFEPRTIGFEQQEALRTLAHEVVSHLELRRTSARLTASIAELELAKKEIEGERARMDALMCDVLPRTIAAELKAHGKVQARYFPLVSVLFTDFHGFTELSAAMEPARLLQTLDQYFGHFDDIVERHGLEKIKTIGDSYMCAGGVPEPGRSHVVDACLAALEMQASAAKLNAERAGLGLPPWEMRIGLHAGPVMTGVVGRRRFTYDVWGDVVNLAQRLEAAGEPRRINVSEAVYHRVHRFFELEQRGDISVRNKGTLPMFFLKGLKPEFSADAVGVTPNQAFSLARHQV